MDSVDALQAAAHALLTAGDVAGADQVFRTLGFTFATDKNAVLSSVQGLRACGDVDGVVAVLEAALKYMPGSPAVLSNLAVAYTEAGRPGEAARILERLAADFESKIHVLFRDPEAWIALGNIRTQLGRWSGAAAAFRQAVNLAPERTDAQMKLATAEMSLGQTAAVAEILERVLASDPAHIAARTLLAEINSQARSNDETLLREAIAADKARLYGPARAKYAALLRQKPGHVVALSRLLTIDGAEGRLDDADVHHRLLIEALAKADLDGEDWRQLAGMAYQTVFRPQPQALYQAVAGALDRQLIKFAGRPRYTPWRAATGRRIKIGYLSTAFCDHPIGHVTSALFGAHDRARFEVHLFYRANGPDDRYTETIARSVEHFIKVPFAEHQIADVVAARDLDILIYLDGYMDMTLLPVAARPAPIQVYWLGHAGGCDISAIDYLLADSTVVPPGEESRYAAKVLRLPECYHCASPHAIAPPPSRADAGLPEEAFVFCAFNNPEKIDRSVFESWMRILARVENSVLWLSQASSPLAADNLRATAAALGIAGSRLIFATRVPDKSHHLGRHMLCGLFLDTFSLNASTVALDALWAGLPVLTLEGPRFGARIAATFLRSLGLEDMIVGSRAAYEDRAVELAGNPEALAEVHARLADARYTKPLFQVDGFCRALEATLEGIFRQAGGQAESDQAERGAAQQRRGL